jgi:DNA-binding MarR family transcriptional regulator
MPAERSAPDDDASSPSLLFEVFALGQQVRRLLATAMAQSALDPTDYAFVSAVFEDEAPTPTTMARRLGMPLSTVVDQVQRFERRGQLRRLRNPADGRSYVVTLTADGLAAHRAAGEAFEQAHAAVDQALGRSKDDVAGAIRLLRAAVDHAAAQAGQGEAVRRRMPASHASGSAARPA